LGVIGSAPKERAAPAASTPTLMLETEPDAEAVAAPAARKRGRAPAAKSARAKKTAPAAAAEKAAPKAKRPRAKKAATEA
ncbi:MAG: 2-oxoglutarate dehydrogenase, E2 component, dihydrolipoamide succinyltransferase, partial [Gemmatimonadota bacterium]|nr:2-oxoglutarate dehydrogenase, E2 component, dihydrolipoamide succinyltransferase [Gemmatimonadota bacterium]